MFSSHRIPAMLVLTLVVGCAGGRQYQNFVDKARTRASFDMGCDPEAVNVTVMATHPSIYGKLPTQVGVTGCDGQRAVYVMDLQTGNWILNSVTRPAGPAQPAAQPQPGASPTPAADPI